MYLKIILRGGGEDELHQMLNESTALKSNCSLLCLLWNYFMPFPVHLFSIHPQISTSSTLFNHVQVPLGLWRPFHMALSRDMWLFLPPSQFRSSQRPLQLTGELRTFF